MSETAQTLIEGALRVLGVIASGEDPTSSELSDGLQALQFMLRSWSAKSIRIYYTKNETLSLTGATSYTIGSGGDLDTVRPEYIRGAYVRDSAGVDNILRIIDEAYYRELSIKSYSSTAEYLWYSPEFPLGKIYLFPAGGNTLYLDSLKQLTDPTIITSTVEFPPEYDRAIKFNLAVDLSPEYGKDPGLITMKLAKESLDALETLNFSNRMITVKPEILKLAQRYNINEG